MNNKLMTCGHSANGFRVSATGEKIPACVICNCIEESKIQPSDIAGRIALCSCCKKQQPSNPDLAFFEYKPNEDHDNYYCGCKGWD